MARRLLSRFAAVTPERRRLLAEAAAALVAAWLLIRVRPFLKTLAFGQPAAGHDDGVAPRHLASAVVSAAGKLPWPMVCFPQGLALQRMLRRRGHDARLHYGIARPGEGPLKAHVWVSLDGETLVGGETAAEFREVARYP
ncbi:lasso peptide biosynthesis B2 protein [Sphingomonas ginkgonis]|uniref:lasso peptide biosynthesis B2 protein n=1 Tax=Sphingomonas ginkgonis TaxID=2315330 RepID=UPI00163AAAB1|nr:lasso peptide biosynthesis B2 protein [Sphingomonas ginkgonis]